MEFSNSKNYLGATKWQVRKMHFVPTCSLVKFPEGPSPPGSPHHFRGRNDVGEGNWIRKTWPNLMNYLPGPFTHFAWSARERAGFVSSETKVLNPNKRVAQSCPTLCNRKDCSLWGSSVHGIFQARVLEWVAISFSRGSSWPRDGTRVSCIAGRHFTL